jgi:hypothetical protein
MIPLNFSLFVFLISHSLFSSSFSPLPHIFFCLFSSPLSFANSSFGTKEKMKRIREREEGLREVVSEKEIKSERAGGMFFLRMGHEILRGTCFAEKSRRD